MYKEKLMTLLESLECQHIDALIEESLTYLETIGKTITKYAKIGAERDIDRPTNNTQTSKNRTENN